MAAAFDSLVAHRGDRRDTPRRVVVAADVDDPHVEVGDDQTAVTVTADVPLARCARRCTSTTPTPRPTSARRCAQLPAALAGDGQALGAVSLTEHELLWFATQEIPDLL